MTVGHRRPVRVRLGEHLEEDVIQLTLEDIAVSLSRLARYTGHGSRFYSVLEHSLLLARYAESYQMVDLARLLLVHDAHEVITGDAVYPMRHTRSPAWDRVKARTTWAFYRKYLGYDPSGRVAGGLAELDRRIVADEMAALWPGHQIPGLPEPLGVEILSTREPRDLVSHFLELAQYLGIEETVEEVDR